MFSRKEVDEMPKIQMAISHSLGKQEALKQVKSLLGRLKAEHGDQIQHLEEKWSGNAGTFSFSAMGFSVSGYLTVEHRQVTLKGKLPLAALPFKGKIERTIREEANKLLLE